MKFVFPIDGIEKDVAGNLGSGTKRGTYPIGKQFNWHGGLHVGEYTTKPIKAIADGVIIAYRVQETSTKINDDDKKGYSTGFVLIQHQYLSPEGRKLVFYSLYMNLLPKDEMEAKKKVPPIFANYKYKVKGKIKKFEEGENLRSEASWIQRAKTVVKFLPNGTKLKVDPEKHCTPVEGKREKYYGEYYEVLSIDDKDDKDHFINVKSGPKLPKNVPATFEFTVNGTVKTNKLLYTGSVLINKADKKTIEVIENGTEVNVSGEEEGYYIIEKVAGEPKEGRIKTLGVEKVPSVVLPEADKLGKVVSGKDCNIPIKAGDVIGFSGPSALNSAPNYKTAHIEVFTDTDPSEFIKGGQGTEKDDTAKTKKHIKIRAGKKLSIKYPVKFKKVDEVEVVEFPATGTYCKIRLHKQIRVVAHSDLNHKDSLTHLDKVIWAEYTPKNLKNLQSQFDSLKKDSLLTWIEHMPDEGGNKRRKVSYSFPSDYPLLWVKKADLSYASLGWQYRELKADAVLCYKNPKGDSPSYILTLPEEDTFDVQLVEDVELAASNIKDTLTDASGALWHKVKRIHDKEGYKEGYILDSDIEKTSAHDWTAFGFKINCIFPNHFVLSSQNDYLKMIWKELGNEDELEKEELARDLKEQVMSRKLSKLICFHNSEWGAEYSSLETEVAAFFDKHIEDADKKVKQDLENKKTASLEALKPKIESLDFWSKVKVVTTQKEVAAATKPKEEKQSLVPFPKSPKVYHFHPIAFVEQMRMMSLANIDVSFQTVISKYRRSVVSKESIGLLKQIGSQSNNKKITISSTIRSSDNQANAMYTNLKKGRNIRYAAPGRAVVEVYKKATKDKKLKAVVLKAMKDKIEELQKENKIVSRHCVSKEAYATLNVIDISFKYGSLSNPKDFVRELAKEDKIKRIIHPFVGVETISKVSYDKNEPAVHIEVYQ